MRLRPSRVLLLLLLPLHLGCWYPPGPALEFDAERLERECAADGSAAIDDEQALCIGRLAGLGRKPRKCPLELAELPLPEGSATQPAFHVVESCSGIALLLDAHGGVIDVRLPGGTP